MRGDEKIMRAGNIKGKRHRGREKEIFLARMKKDINNKMSVTDVLHSTNDRSRSKAKAFVKGQS